MKQAFYSLVALTSGVAFAQIDVKPENVSNDIKWFCIDGDPISCIQDFVKWLLGLLWIIMVIICIWWGWKILSSGGEDEGKEAGKKIITNAVIGILVIFFAWTISSLVFGLLQK